MATSTSPQLEKAVSPQDRRAKGKAIRKTVPRSSHDEWSPPADRQDPVDVITSQDGDRLQWLVPIRHGRMSDSPFAFFRGAAKIMAADLSHTPRTGLNTQICGDAHLANFGSYGSPDRRQVFDVNDFDETLPGPWEWDLKRLATSVVLAGRDNEFDDADMRASTLKALSGYREAMAEFGDARTLDIWYSQLSIDDIVAVAPTRADQKRVKKSAKKARSKDSLTALSKLAEKVNGTYRIKSQPPLLIPVRELPASQVPNDLNAAIDDSLSSYRSTLSDNRKLLFDRFTLVDVALKVVGVGSVGTRCMIVLFQGRDDQDPLFLQIKEATSSVLEEHLPKSRYEEYGKRVVEGQRLMQASSDIFLGWTVHLDSGWHYYWRQFHDMKGSPNVAAMNPAQLGLYARLCGWTLAHAHARSGDPIAISGYLGSGDVFDRSVADFAFAYADQNDTDYQAFVSAIKSGKIEAVTGE